MVARSVRAANRARKDVFLWTAQGQQPASAATKQALRKNAASGIKILAGQTRDAVGFLASTVTYPFDGICYTARRRDMLTGQDRNRNTGEVAPDQDADIDTKA